MNAALHKQVVIFMHAQQTDVLFWIIQGRIYSNPFCIDRQVLKA